jgi:DNA-binding response OmpR family regulator
VNNKLLKKSIVLLPASDENAVELLNAILLEYGFKPVQIADWEHLTEHLSESCPDLLVMNMDKPDYQSIERLDALRNCTMMKNVPLIIVSSQDKNEFFTSCPLSIRETLITKPVPEDVFISAVEKAISN